MICCMRNFSSYPKSRKSISLQSRFSWSRGGKRVGFFNTPNKHWSILSCTAFKVEMLNLSGNFRRKLTLNKIKQCLQKKTSISRWSLLSQELKGRNFNLLSDRSPFSLAINQQPRRSQLGSRRKDSLPGIHFWWYPSKHIHDSRYPESQFWLTLVSWGFYFVKKPIF